MMEDDLAEVLHLVTQTFHTPKSRVYGTGLWRKCHQLAEAHYRPAIPLFVQFLEDERWDWREVGVSLLGFHYELDQGIVERIGELLLKDPEPGVRIACAFALGEQSTYPDKALIEALENDVEPEVRDGAFSSLLKLAKVPYAKMQHEKMRLRVGEITPDFHEVKRIINESNEGKESK